MVGTIKQKPFDQLRIARHKAATQARHIAALGQAGKHQHVLEIAAPQLLCGLQAPQGRLVAEIDFAVALVGCDDKAVSV